MEELLQFFATYGYLVVLFGVLIEQLGIPLPSNFVLIIAGALAGGGQLELTFVILIAVLACLIGNTIWFYVGRTSGYKVLGFLCRISLEPDRCVNSSKSLFKKQGARSLLVAKFIPGFSIFAPPLAGATRMSLGRFLIFDLLGAFLWVGVFAALGFLFSNQIESVIEYAGSFGAWSGAIVLLGLACYLAWKYIARQRFIRSLRVARIKAEEVKERLDANEEMLIVDLRDPLDFESNPIVISTAVRIPLEEIEERHHDLPRDQDVILYCT
ncbi:MAG: sulfurtransferase [Pyrinomonadaceae bacterium]|nr:sulfurtransferase [Pyrinomonadaceae bacterium]